MLEMGKIEKLWIESFLDNEAGSQPRNIEGKTKFYALVNPENFTRKYAIEYVDQNVPNTTQQAKYFRTKPEEFKLDLLIDGTGVVKDAGIINIGIANPFEDSDNDVTARIELLKKFCYSYEGEIHRPCYIKICWGTTDGLFKGILTSLDIDYKLFRPDGKPIRAMAHLSLISALNPEEAVRLEDNRSPDITHQRIFKAGDRFTLLINKIYNDQQYYIDVARANKMPGFRKIAQGTKINFPPIK